MIHRFPIRVYYEDTDMAGIVYYANYLRFIERARSDWVRCLGLDQNAMREGDGIVFAVRRVEADYIRPAKFEDDLEIVTRVESVTPARLIMGQEVCRDGQVIFRARVEIACLTLEGRPVRLPGAVRRSVTDTDG